MGRAGPEVVATRRDVAILFCDLVGSTALLSRIGEAANDEVRRDLFSVLRAPVEALGGQEVKTQGDGLMAAFDDLDTAVRCATAMHQGVERLSARDPEIDLAIRVGVAAGEATFEEDDWFGTPVVAAARLCGAAGTGETLLTASSIPAGAPVAFERAGDLDLKGFPDPVPTVRAVWNPPVTRAGVPLPPDLDLGVAPALVGRGDELAALVDHWRATCAGAGPAVTVVTGEPGAGTTRLLAEVAGTAHADGATVLSVRCEVDDHDLDAFARALRWLALGATDDDLDRRLARAGTVLASSVPAVARRRAAPPPATTPSVEERIDATAAALTSAGPTLVVVDDLQHATGPALVAVLAVATARTAPVLVVCGHRPLGHEDRAVALTLDKLHDLPSSQHVQLAPFDAAATAALARALAPGVPLDPTLARDIVAETGGSPARTVEIARKLRPHDDGSAAAVERAITLACPYKGLEPFAESDASRFFGRGDLVDQLVERTSGSPFIAVVGASGSGKSSLLRAGLVPALAGRGWTVVTFTPGDHPAAALAGALTEVARADRAVVAVDQLEEAFTLCRDPVERDAFLDALATETHAHVVVTMRGDFFGHAAAHPPLAAALERGTVLLGPMSADDLRAAVEGPARQTGLELEPGLADLVVRDVVGEPGGLPLLSHALRETWRRHRGRLLSVADYRAAGGARGAIARTADLVFTTQLDGDEQAVARTLFLRLTEPGEGTQDTRRRASRADFFPRESDRQRNERVLGVLTAARLVTVDDDDVEVAHEALIRERPRLRGWLDEDREAVRVHAQLGHAARQWDDGGRQPADLYRGTRLQLVHERVAGNLALSLSATEEAFVAASDEAQQAETHRDRRTRRRLRRLLAATGVGLVLAVVAGAVALDQRSTARDEAATAREQAAIADLRRLAAQANAVVGTRPDTAALLAVEASTLDATTETDSALLTSLERHPAVLNQYFAQPGVLGAPAISPDGALVAAPVLARGGGEGDGTGAVAVFDVETGVEQHRIGLEEPARAVAFTADGDLLVVTPSGVVQLATDGATTGAPIDLDGASRLVVEPGGERVAVSTGDGRVHVVDLTTGDVVAGPFAPGFSDGAPVAAWRRDGGALAVGEGPPGASGLDTSSDVVVFDVATGVPLGPAVTIDGTEVSSLAFDASGTRLAVTGNGAAPASAGGVANVIDVGTGETTRVPMGTDRTTASVAASPDGASFAFVDGTGLVRRWDPVVGTAAGADLTTPSTLPRGITVSPDGRSAFVAGGAGGVVRLALDGRTALTGTALLPGSPVAVSPNGERIAVNQTTPTSPPTYQAVVVDDEGEVLAGPVPGFALGWAADDVLLVNDLAAGLVLVDLVTGDVTLPELPEVAGTPVNVVPITADHRTVLMPDTGGSVALDVVSGELGTTFSTEESYVRTGAWTVDGRQLIALEAGPQTSGLRLYDGATGAPAPEPIGGLLGSATAIVAHPGGRTAAVGTEAGPVNLVDLATGEATDTVYWGHTGSVFAVAFTPDGARLVTVADDNTLRMFAVDGEPLGETVTTDPGLGLVVTADAVYYQADLVVRRIPLDPQIWRDTACRRAGRNLTEQEWRQYLPADQPYRATCPQYPR